MLLKACWFLLELLMFCLEVVTAFSQLRALMGIPVWFLDIPANLTHHTVIGLLYRCSSELLMHVQDASLGMVLSVSLNVLSGIGFYTIWRKLHPKPENVEWQGIWRGLGKRLEAWGPPVSWNFTLEHLWDPEELNEYLGKGWCSSGRSEQERLIWGLACAYRALYNTILERESFQTEIRARRENFQVDLDESQEAPVSMSVAPVEGRKWKRVSSRLEREEEEEEAEEDPDEGLSSRPPPPRKATKKSERHGEENDGEGVTVITTRRSLKMTEMQGIRKEYMRHPGETVLAWLLRCWDNGVSSVSLDSSEARQLGNIARDTAIDRGISRCLDGAATLWERLLLAVKEKYPFRAELQPGMKVWNTVEKGIQYLRETAIVEMLYDPAFVSNDPEQDHDPEKTPTTPEIWRKLTRTAPERYAASLVTTIGRWEDLDKRPAFCELIVALQNLDQKLPPSHASISAICQMAERLDKMEKSQDSMREELSLVTHRDEPVAVSETPDEDQDSQRNVLKELVKMIQVSAIKGKRPPPRAKDRSKFMSRAALWSYLREHGEDMRKWHDEPTPALRARVRELQSSSTATEVAPVTAGNK